MISSTEEMAYILHAKDHKAFEKVSEKLSNIMRQKYTLFYSWCKTCNEIIEKEEKK